MHDKSDNHTDRQAGSHKQPNRLGLWLQSTCCTCAAEPSRIYKHMSSAVLLLTSRCRPALCPSPTLMRCRQCSACRSDASWTHTGTYTGTCAARTTRKCLGTLADTPPTEFFLKVYVPTSLLVPARLPSTLHDEAYRSKCRACVVFEGCTTKSGSEMEVSIYIAPLLGPAQVADGSAQVISHSPFVNEL